MWISFRIKCPRLRNLSRITVLHVWTLGTLCSPARWSRQYPNFRVFSTGPRPASSDLSPLPSSRRRVCITRCLRLSPSPWVCVGCPGTPRSTPAWTAAGCATASIYTTPSETPPLPSQDSVLLPVSGWRVMWNFRTSPVLQLPYIHF